MNKYETIANEILQDVEKQINHSIIIEYWQSKNTTSGKAWHREYKIKTPIPISLYKLYIFCHELAHILNAGLKPSCLNEFYADQFAINKLREYGLKISRDIIKHNRYYMAFSLAQALNRNLKNIPGELKRYKKYLNSYDVSIIKVKNGKQTIKRVKRYKANINKC